MAADNLQLSANVGTGAVLRTLADGSGNEWPVGVSAFPTNGANPWTLQLVNASNGLPVQQQTSAVWDYNLKNYGGSAVGAGNALHVQPGTGATFAVSGTVTSNIGSGNLAGITGTVTVQGGAASGATTAGNPIQAGGVFNTTQPTVTTGQAVQLQATARGGLIVSTGVDTFNVTVNAALPAGGNTIGAVTQASGPWTENLTQISGSAISTAASGTQKVGIVGNAGAAFDAAGQNVASPANEILVGGQFNTSPTTISSGNMSPLQLDSAGNLLVNLKANSFGTVTVTGTVTANQGGAPWSENITQFGGNNLATGTGAGGSGIPRVTVSNDSNVLATQSGTWTVQPGNTANTTPWLVTDTPATSGGLSFNNVLAGASNNLTQIKGTAGQFYFVSAQNVNASPRYVKVFNKTSANVTMGTTNADYQFLIPGNANGAGLVLNIDKGIAMGTAITIAITAGVALNDNTSVSANDVNLIVGYK